MTYSLVESKDELSECRQLFIQNLRLVLYEKVAITVGYQGGSFWDKNAAYSPELQFWMSIDAPKAKKRRYWQSFGIGPYRQGNNSITGEINFPHKGMNHRIAGAFLKDHLGQIWIAHSGKIGGGKAGVGKKLFWKYWSIARTTEILSQGKKRRYALIAKLSSPQLAEEVRNFIHFINDLKKGILVPDPLPQYNYSDEFIGAISAYHPGEINYYRWHGVIIQSLYNELQKRGYSVGKNKHIDLYVGNTSRITTIFEIKTDSTLGSLYKAIGQLLCYAAQLPHSPRKILVIPEIPTKALSAVLNDLNIGHVTFDQVADKIVFKHDFLNL